MTAIFLDAFKKKVRIRALLRIVHGKVFIGYCHVFCIFAKARFCAVKRKAEQFIAVIRNIGSFKSEFLRKVLIRKPRFLLLRAEHTDSRLTFGFCVGYAVFHKLFSVPVRLLIAVYPKAVDIQKVLALYRNPRFFKRRVFDKNRRLFVKLSENMTFFQPLCEPCSLCLDSRMRLFCAYYAAKVLIGKIFGRQIYKFTHKFFSALIFLSRRKRQAPFFLKYRCRRDLTA